MSSFIYNFVFVFELLFVLTFRITPSRADVNKNDRHPQGDLAGGLLNYDFGQNIISDFGSNRSLSVSQLQEYLNSWRTQRRDTVKNGGAQGIPVQSKQPSPCNNTDLDCLKNKCLSAYDIFNVYSLSNNSHISSEQLNKITPLLLYQIQNNGCANQIIGKNTHKKSKKPTTGEVWGYSFLFVTVTNICALTGVCLVPCMAKAFYKKMLIFLVALAVSCLCGSSLLFLIPDAFGLYEYDEHGKYSYKSMVIIVGVYIFFLLEYLMRFIMSRKEKNKNKRQQMSGIASIRTENTEPEHVLTSAYTTVNVDPEVTARLSKDHSHTKAYSHLVRDNGSSIQLLSHRQNSADVLERSSSIENLEERGNKKLNAVPLKSNGISQNGISIKSSESGIEMRLESSSGSEADEEEEKEDKNQNVKPKRQKKKKSIAPVAWMIIFGDAVHNFIDGLSMGAAFTGSIYLGISVSLAVICEELPHELGDFAILINSGMSRWKAVSFNFLSALTCYLGMILGIVVSEAESADKWIFAFSGGMFLYISLVDLMPEMNHAPDAEENKNESKAVIFILQNAGLITGFTIMYLLAKYGAVLEIEET